MTPATVSILLTPPGAGAIAVIQVVGPEAVRIADQAFKPRRGTNLAASGPGRLRYGHIMDGEEQIDDVITCRIDDGADSPVEICSHGGIRVVERILTLLERLGAPFSNDRSLHARIWHPRNTIEAEALHAMSHAKTERGLSFLAFQRQHLAVHLERLADQFVSAPHAARAEMRRLLDAYPAARTLLAGWTVAIIGPPNSGKSTLFNRLVGRERAVVSDQAGTTRDWIEEEIEIEGLPVRLIDTAGRRDTFDPLEREAIHSGSRAIEAADLLLLVLDRSSQLADLATLPAHERMAVVPNKSDLPTVWDLSDLPAALADRLAPVSASTGAGVPALLRQVLGRSGIDRLATDQPCLFTPRQQDAALQAHAASTAGQLELAQKIMKHKLLSAQ